MKHSSLLLIAYFLEFTLYNLDLGDKHLICAVTLLASACICQILEEIKEHLPTYVSTSAGGYY